MDMDVCIKVAPILRVNAFWLFDESRGMDSGLSSEADPNNQLATNEAQPPEYLSLSNEEQQLISAYRQAGDAERNFILRAAGVRISLSSDMRTELNKVKSSLAGGFTGAGADEAVEEVVGGTKNSPRKRAGEGRR